MKGVTLTSIETGDIVLPPLNCDFAKFPDTSRATLLYLHGDSVDLLFYQAFQAGVSSPNSLLTYGCFQK